MWLAKHLSRAVGEPETEPRNPDSVSPQISTLDIAPSSTFCCLLHQSRIGGNGFLIPSSTNTASLSLMRHTQMGCVYMEPLPARRYSWDSLAKTLRDWGLHDSLLARLNLDSVRIVLVGFRERQEELADWRAWWILSCFWMTNEQHQPTPHIRYLHLARRLWPFFFTDENLTRVIHAFVTTRLSIPLITHGHAKQHINTYSLRTKIQTTKMSINGVYVSHN